MDIPSGNQTAEAPESPSCWIWCCATCVRSTRPRATSRTCLRCRCRAPGSEDPGGGSYSESDFSQGYTREFFLERREEELVRSVNLSDEILWNELGKFHLNNLTTAQLLTNFASRKACEVPDWVASSAHQVDPEPAPLYNINKPWYLAPKTSRMADIWVYNIRYIILYNNTKILPCHQEIFHQKEQIHEVFEQSENIFADGLWGQKAPLTFWFWMTCAPRSSSRVNHQQPRSRRDKFLIGQWTVAQICWKAPSSTGDSSRCLYRTLSDFGMIIPFSCHDHYYHYDHVISLPKFISYSPLIFTSFFPINVISLIGKPCPISIHFLHVRWTYGGWAMAWQVGRAVPKIGKALCGAPAWRNALRRDTAKKVSATTHVNHVTLRLHIIQLYIIILDIIIIICNMCLVFCFFSVCFCRF